MNAADVALILLAAGKSTRFGGSKLDAPLDGLPLGLHVVHTLADIRFARRLAITGRAAIDYAAAGFTILPNHDPVGDMASSLRLGVAAAGDAAAVLILLADMPRVTAAHVRRLLDAAEGATAIVASSAGGAPRPPALFGQAHLARLATITGDHGARALLRDAKLIAAPREELVDIDTAADLAGLR